MKYRDLLETTNDCTDAFTLALLEAPLDVYVKFTEKIAPIMDEEIPEEKLLEFQEYVKKYEQQKSMLGRIKNAAKFPMRDKD